MSSPGYTIVGPLGSGVWARCIWQHPRLPRRDALKILRPDLSMDGAFRRRFAHEAELAARLTPPRRDCPMIAGFHINWWIVTQYIAGTDAGRLLRHHPAGLSAGDATAIIAAVAGRWITLMSAACFTATSNQPTSAVGPDPGHRHVYLADFGIARPMDGANGITATNTTLGTFAYSRTRATDGSRPLDGRADQYALAATLTTC